MLADWERMIGEACATSGDRRVAAGHAPAAASDRRRARRPRPLRCRDERARMLRRRAPPYGPRARRRHRPEALDPHRRARPPRASWPHRPHANPATAVGPDRAHRDRPRHRVAVDAAFAAVEAASQALSDSFRRSATHSSQTRGDPYSRRPYGPPAMPTDRTKTLGRRGEALAAEHFERLGYRVLARNHRTRFGRARSRARGRVRRHDRVLRGQGTPRRRRLAREPARGASAGRCARWPPHG